jgi:hypothetical protein
MKANLFDVLDKVNKLPDGKLHAYFADNIMDVKAGKEGWGSVKMAIITGDAQKIMNAIMGGQNQVSVMLFVVDRQSLDETKNAIEIGPEEVDI